jgi:hypothetical protein
MLTICSRSVMNLARHAELAWLWRFHVPSKDLAGVEDLQTNMLKR